MPVSRANVLQNYFHDQNEQYCFRSILRTACVPEIVAGPLGRQGFERTSRSCGRDGEQFAQRTTQTRLGFTESHFDGNQVRDIGGR